MARRVDRGWTDRNGILRTELPAALHQPLEDEAWKTLKAEGGRQRGMARGQWESPENPMHEEKPPSWVTLVGWGYRRHALGDSPVSSGAAGRPQKETRGADRSMGGGRKGGEQIQD